MGNNVSRIGAGAFANCSSLTRCPGPGQRYEHRKLGVRTGSSLTNAVIGSGSAASGSGLRGLHQLTGVLFRGMPPTHGDRGHSPATWMRLSIHCRAPTAGLDVCGVADGAWVERAIALQYYEINNAPSHYPIHRSGSCGAHPSSNRAGLPSPGSPTGRFLFCASLTNSRSPNSVTTIGRRRFYGAGPDERDSPTRVTRSVIRVRNSGLTSVRIPDSVTMIAITRSLGAAA